MVAEIDPQIRAGRKRGHEAVGAAVLKVIHHGNVVTIFVNVHRAFEARPRFWLVAGVNFVTLQLARTDACKRIVVVAEHQFRIQAQGIYGHCRDAEHRGAFVDLRDVARSVVTDYRRRIGRRAQLHGAIRIFHASRGQGACDERAIAARREEIVRGGSCCAAGEINFAVVECGAEIGDVAGHVHVADVRADFSRDVVAQFDQIFLDVLSEKLLHELTGYVSAGAGDVLRTKRAGYGRAAGQICGGWRV